MNLSLNERERWYLSALVDQYVYGESAEEVVKAALRMLVGVAQDDNRLPRPLSAINTLSAFKLELLQEIESALHGGGVKPHKLLVSLRQRLLAEDEPNSLHNDPSKEGDV